VSTAGSQTQIALRDKWGPIKSPEGRIMTLTQQWRYLNLTRGNFYILFPAKGIVSYGQVISSRLRSAHSFERNLFTRWPNTFKKQ